MQITESNYLYGPNIYSDKPAFWGVFSVDQPAACNTARLGPGFGAALLDLLPGLASHKLEEGQFFSELMQGNDGIHMGRVLERIAIELQNLAGHQSAWGTTILQETPGSCKVIVECHDITIYPFVLRTSLLILVALLPESLRDDIMLPAGFNLKSNLPAYLNTLRSLGLDLSTKAIVDKAQERDIPWQRLHPNYPYVQLGQGCFAKQVFETSSTADNPILLNANKNVAAMLLDKMGLPVPKQTIVSTARQAVAAARDIGYPVVIKPNQGKKGQGVAVNVANDQDVLQAVSVAGKYDGLVVVEKYIAGHDHRLLIVNGKFVAAAKRIPAHVIGDGVHSIEELVDEVNKDPRRGIGFEKHLVQLQLDDRSMAKLKKTGYSHKSVPGLNEVVYLSDTANISTGGTAIDVTDQVHPDNRFVAETAAFHLGLAVSGVDFITPDISRSWREVPGCIIEVNRCPGLRPHWIADPARDVVGPILDMLFPENQQARIPIAAVTGSNGKTTTCQMLAHILQSAGMKCGLATTQGIFINGTQIRSGDFAGNNGASIIFLDPQVEVAVLESARGGLLRNGLSFGHCEVGAILNIRDEHVGTDGVETVDELARVKRLVAEGARKAVVLNAEDDRCLAMASHSPAQKLCLVATDKDNRHVESHIAHGGQAVFLEEIDGRRHIVLFEGKRFLTVIETASIPASFNNMAFCNVENAMFAAAIAWEMGVSVDAIGEGLRTFQSSYDCNPGRLNIYDGLPFRVILDFAHNPTKYKAMVEFVDSLSTEGRRIIVISPSASRSDENLRQIAKECAGFFDHYFLARRDVPKMKRGEFGVQEFLHDALHSFGVDSDCMTVCGIETEATQQALTFAKPGETLVLAVFDSSSCWELVTKHKT